jgi:hypothetical protein
MFSEAELNEIRKKLLKNRMDWQSGTYTVLADRTDGTGSVNIFTCSTHEQALDMLQSTGWTQSTLPAKIEIYGICTWGGCSLFGKPEVQFCIPLYVNGELVLPIVRVGISRRTRP